MGRFSNEASAITFTDPKVKDMVPARDFAQGQVFYSPLRIWYFFLGMVLLGFDTVDMLCLAFPESLLLLLLLPPYVALSIRVMASLNHHFVLTDRALWVVNTSPWRRSARRIALAEIQAVRIGSHRKMRRWAWLFLVVGSNFVELKVSGSWQRFYCVHLEEDCFDENWTALNLDDLFLALQRRGLEVQMDLEK